MPDLRQYIYILRDPCHSVNVYKVGGTNDPKERLSDPSYSTAREIPCFFERVYQLLEEDIDENRIHNLLRDKKITSGSSEMYKEDITILSKTISDFLCENNFEFIVYDKSKSHRFFGSRRSVKTHSTQHINENSDDNSSNYNEIINKSNTKEAKTEKQQKDITIRLSSNPTKSDLNNFAREIKANGLSTDMMTFLYENVEESDKQMLKLNEELKEIEKMNPIYPDQKEQAELIFKKFFEENKIAITLILECQGGKTGIAVYTAYLLCTIGKIPADNIYFITGMSDKDWQGQTEERVLKSFEDHVMHRPKLKNLKQIRNNSFLILDESHFGTESGGDVKKAFEANKFFDTDALEKKNIKILFTSATPDGLMLDSCKVFGEKHCKMKFIPPDTYYGCKKMLQNGKVKELGDLLDYNWCKNIADFIKEKFDLPKYHLIRLQQQTDKQQVELENLHRLCEEYGWNIKSSNSKNRMDLNRLFNHQPEVHTIILFKNQLRAAKTIVKEYIGILHDRKCKKYNNSTVVQGFFGRICGYHNFHHIFIFTDVDSVKKYYSLFYDHDINYDKVDYIGTRMKKNKDGIVEGNKTLLDLSNFGKNTQYEKWILKEVEFNNKYEMENYIYNRTITIDGKKKNVRKTNINTKKREYRDYDGFSVSTILPEKKVKYLSSEDRLLREDIDKKKGQSGRLAHPSRIKDKMLKICSVIPFYENKTSKRNEVKWLVKHWADNPPNQILCE